MIRRVCVFAGSQTGARPAYARAAAELGRTLAERGIGLVYGGGRIGLMGVLADAALAGGGHVVGVIPADLFDREVAHGGLSELRVVDSMHERKAVMYDAADAFVALPGGLGTLEETLEVLTWSQLGLHAKPVGLLDVDRYYAGLEQLLDHAVDEALLSAANRARLLTRTEPAALLDALAGATVAAGEGVLDDRAR